MGRLRDIYVIITYFLSHDYVCRFGNKEERLHNKKAIKMVSRPSRTLRALGFVLVSEKMLMLYSCCIDSGHFFSMKSFCEV